MPHASIPRLDIDLSERQRFRQGMPWETLEEIRSGAPVWWHPPTEGTREILETGFYVVTRHADLVAVARDPERFSSRDGVGLRAVGEVPSISSLDPPEQTRWRRLIGRSFTPGTVRRLEERMQTWTDQILDAVLPLGRCDFVQEVSHLLPLHVIADIVGIPAQDRAEVFDRVNDMVRHEDPLAALPEGTFEDAVKNFKSSICFSEKYSQYRLRSKINIAGLRASRIFEAPEKKRIEYTDVDLRGASVRPHLCLKGLWKQGGQWGLQFEVLNLLVQAAADAPVPF